MAITSLRIPQIGEGLQEARLVAVLKQPGEHVKRDEPIYQMETDKAVMDVESPFEGVLVEWCAPVDTILAIGAEVAKMEVSGPVQEMAVGHGPAPTPAPASPAPTSTTGESLASLRIPQIGEGLQEARLIAVLKQPGDLVKRDDPIYQMETDKAVMDVESPYEGVLVEWCAEVDTVLAIGAEVARMRVAGPVQEMAIGHGPASSAPAVSAPATAVVASVPATSGPLRAGVLPPRSKAYAQERGVSDADLNALAASVGKVMPNDIDAWLAKGGAVAPVSVGGRGLGVGGGYEERAVASKQRLLASRLQRGSQLVVPGTITVATRWEGVERRRAAYKASGGDFQPSAFTIFAYAVSLALKEHPLFRSTLKGDEVLRTYDHASLGIAVALPGDELVLAVVENADNLGWEEFASATRASIDLARSGKDQANEAVTISLTNMQSFGLRDAVPVVVPPSVGTLFLGEVYQGLDQAASEPKLARYVNLALTFDHRLINGVGGAEFINAVKRNVEGIEALLS